MSDVLTGGCQCGAVRFRVEGPPLYSTICHCRMCQKAFSAPFAASVSVPAGQVFWTRGERRRFLSSDTVARTFCGDCGSQLTFEGANGSRNIALSTCAFDDPSTLPPTHQSGAESRLAWLDGLDALPWPTEAATTAQEAKYGPRISRQHPDHDTEVWPPIALSDAALNWPRHIVAVGGLVRAPDGKVLLVKSPLRGWEFPGGQVELGESLTEALEREVLEEAGVVVRIGALVGVYSNLTPPTKVMFDFLCNWVEGQPSPSEESLESGWFEPDDAASRVTWPAYVDRLRELLNFSGSPIYRVYESRPYRVVGQRELAADH